MITDPDAPELTLVGRVPSGSNAVFLCTDPDERKWVYKPVRGERPLWDFPEGTLAAREVAAYRVSEALGWGLVPETLAVAAAGGPGMAQRWVAVGDSEAASSPATAPDPVGIFGLDEVPDGYAAIVRGEDETGRDVVVAHERSARVRRIALFDHIINNADRKGGHLLVDEEGRIWGIDHGLALHVEPKVRTVLWGWAGEPLDEEDAPGLAHLAEELAPGGGLRMQLTDLLSEEEAVAAADRVEVLRQSGRFPTPGVDYPLPWPLF